MRYLEDFRAGELIELGEVRISEAEILDFGRRFDPQPFHVDPSAAAASQFGGLIASGWHTGALYMRLFVDAVLSGSASLGSPGLEEVRWLRPVRPGDVLRGTYEILAVTNSAGRDDRGTIRARCEMLDSSGEVVMRLVARNHFSRRPPA